MCVRVFSACVPVCECVCLFFRHIAAIECKQKDNNNNGTADMGAGEGVRSASKGTQQFDAIKNETSGIPQYVQQLVLFIRVGRTRGLGKRGCTKTP